MEHFNHYVNAGYSPRYVAELNDDLVFCGTVTRRDCEPEDVYHARDEDSLVVVRWDHDCSPAMPRSICQSIAQSGGMEDSMWDSAFHVWQNSGHESPVVSSPDLRLVQITVHGSVTNEDGESGYRIIFVTHNDVPEDVLSNLVREQHPQTFCQHEYDCCGRAYSSWPSLQLRNEVYAVYKQSWHLNI